MAIHELIICCALYHLQQTSATPQRAPEVSSVQCIGLNANFKNIKFPRGNYQTNSSETNTNTLLSLLFSTKFSSAR